MLHIHIFFSKIEYRGKQLKELVLSSLPYSSDITFFYLGSFLDDDKLFFSLFPRFCLLLFLLFFFQFLQMIQPTCVLCSLIFFILTKFRPFSHYNHIPFFSSLLSPSLSLSFIFYADGNFHLANSPGSFLRIQL